MTSSHGGGFNIRHAWFIGGVLLLATVLADVAVGPPGPLVAIGGILGPVLFAGALLVFAFGIRGTGSVTARRPLGTAALTLLAAWILLQSVLTDVLGSSASADSIPALVITLSYVDPFLRFALSLIAVIQIARAGVVPSPWNWAPFWALGALTVPWLLGQVFVVVGTSPETEATTILFIATLDSLIRVGSATFLGVLAILLADRARRPQAVSARSTADTAL